VGIFHLENAAEGIISFGQGCEGEPSLSFENITKAMQLIRERTRQGMININTNAGFTKGIKAIVDAGLDSMRVSIISAMPDVYQAYYRSNYSLSDVRESIDYAKQAGVYVSLNMLTFPGLNDRPEEVKAWIEFIKQTGVDMIQLRNLNVDPDAFMEIMPDCTETPIGIRPFIEALRQNAPGLSIGSFSHYLRK
jgi:molybdenum cofactor biosynthesis enzyme MoaA